MYKTLVVALFSACLVNVASLVDHLAAWPASKKLVVASHPIEFGGRLSEAIQF